MNRCSLYVDEHGEKSTSQAGPSIKLDPVIAAFWPAWYLWRYLSKLREQAAMLPSIDIHGGKIGHKETVGNARKGLHEECTLKENRMTAAERLTVY